jgi:hypothetical protein
VLDVKTSISFLNIAVSKFGKVVKTIEEGHYFTFYLIYITFKIFDLDIHPDNRSSQG